MAGQKTCHFIFHHNSGVSWWIFKLCILVKRGMNTLQNIICKIYNCTLTVFNCENVIMAAAWDDWPTAIEPVVRNFRRKSSDMFALQFFLLRYSLMSLWAENLLHSCRLWSKCYLHNLTHSHIFHFIALLNSFIRQSGRLRQRNTDIYKEIIIITHDVPRWSEHCSVTDAVMTSSSVR